MDAIYEFPVEPALRCKLKDILREVAKHPSNEGQDLMFAAPLDPYQLGVVVFDEIARLPAADRAPFWALLDEFSNYLQSVQQQAVRIKRWRAIRQAVDSIVIDLRDIAAALSVVAFVGVVCFSMGGG